MATDDPSSESLELHVLGRLATASNLTLLCETADGQRWIHKPIAGEQPLWDFPTGTLGRREAAAYAISAAAGFDVVPQTLLVEGPFGPGSLQRWIADADSDELVAVVPGDEVPAGWFAVLTGVDENDDPVTVCHADDPRLRRIALFDALINNSDRKAGHLLAAPDGQLWGCDHGVSLSVAPKLRTVLWGWAGASLTDAELALVDAAAGAAGVLEPHMSGAEVAAFIARCEAVRRAGRFPEPSPNWPAVPWPVF